MTGEIKAYFTITVNEDGTADLYMQYEGEPQPIHGRVKKLVPESFSWGITNNLQHRIRKLIEDNGKATKPEE